MKILHPLVNRTSPKGEAFLGKCASCGKENITFEQLNTDECPNPRGMDMDTAIIEAIMGNGT